MFKQINHRNIIKGHGIKCDQESLEGRRVSLVRDRPRGGGGGGYIRLNFLNATDVGREWWREGLQEGYRDFNFNLHPKYVCPLRISYSSLPQLNDLV